MKLREFVPLINAPRHSNVFELANPGRRVYPKNARKKPILWPRSYAKAAKSGPAHLNTLIANDYCRAITYIL
jgi:hypothetical protein